jgi:hypothetical protein
MKMNPDWLAKFVPFSDILMDFGWFVPPYIFSRDFDRLEAAVDSVRKCPPANAIDREAIEDKACAEAVVALSWLCHKPCE